MTSGIYKLTFRNGSFYIGKSIDIPKRWAQHIKGLEAGTHTKNMQAVYDVYGAPTKEIILECHPDHIDILESYYINKFWSNSILNTTRPKPFQEAEIFIIETFPEVLWNMSTFEHIARFSKAVTEKNEALELLEKSQNSIYLANLRSSLEDANNKIRKLESRGFFSRLFNR